VKLYLAQINTTVGDLEGNARRIVVEIERARALGAALAIFPELATTGYPPRDLLETCRRLEREAGRERRERWGPRTLDVDIIWIDGVTLDEPDLVVPHPRMRERPFVLAPLADVAPDLVAPDWAAAFDHLGIRVWSETSPLRPVSDQTGE
jgi:2-amino-4-hydroxy-6-hydroxymethyldihydropteridine diphosphokinase